MKQSVQRLTVGLIGAVIGVTSSSSSLRAQDFATSATKQQVATCNNVAELSDCHPHYPTGCSAAKKPRYDAYLNYLKDQDPSPTAQVSKILTEQDWMAKEAQLADLDLTKTNHATHAKELADLDEGKIVGIVGYVYYRVTNSGETSNCQLTGIDNNDFHIGLGFDSSVAARLAAGQAVPEMQSTSIIVEMTPQYRANHHPKWTGDTVDQLIGHQVKAVGQLIVDNEHMAGKDDCGSPDAEATCWRSSIWELHPVVAFYYCPSDSCAANSADWVALDGPINLAQPSPKPLTVAPAPVRLIARADDGASVTVAANDGAPKTLAVAPKAQPAVRQLKAGDTVRVTLAGSQAQTVEVGTVSATRGQRLIALLIAFVVIAALLMLLRVSPKELVRGKDGPYSKSHFQVALWFFALISGYLATLGLRWWASGWSLVGGVGIPTDLLVISGISAFTFVGAKAVTINKMAQSAAVQAAKSKNTPPSFPSDLVNDDAGRPDLGDTQMILITLVAVATYLAMLFSWWSVISLAANIMMPNIDSTLVAVFGLGQGAYLVKKQIE
jgi:hypothetical protein